MMKMAKIYMPKFIDLTNLHLLNLFSHCSTILHIYLIQYLHTNPNLLHLSRGYVSQEVLSFPEDHIITTVFKNYKKDEICI